MMLTFIGWQKGPAALPLAMSKWWIHSNNSMLFQVQSTYTIMMSQWSLSISQTISYCGTCPLQLVVQIRFVNRHIPIMWIAHRTSAPHVDNNLFTRAGVAKQCQYGQAAWRTHTNFFHPGASLQGCINISPAWFQQGCHVCCAANLSVVIN